MNATLSKIWLAEVWRSWRASLRRPGFLALASGVLVLGIGASVAVFALIDQVLLQPLPVPDPSRVVVIGPLEGGGPGSVSPQQFQHLGSLSGVESMGLAFSLPPANVMVHGRPEVVSATYIDHGLLPTLGLRPLLGHNFTAGETEADGPHVVLLGYGFWKRHFGGDRNVLGQTLRVKGSLYTIIGVLPASFDATAFSADVVLPLALPANDTDDGTNYTAVARLAPGASPQLVATEVTARMHAMYAAMTGYAYRSGWLKIHFGVQPITAWQNSDANASLTLFMACALFVLATALVNLVNLMLLRSLSRAHDAAVRGALGAPPLRLALPALAEGLLIGVIGALVGTALATLGLHWLQGSVSADWLPTGGIHVAWWLWLLALAVAIAVAVLAAAFGVWRSQATAATDELREGGRSLGRRGGRLGWVLVMVQMVLATVLLCATGLLLRGLYQASSTPLGYSTQHILTFDLAPLRTDYPDAKSVDSLSRRLVRRLETIPGVTGAVATTNLPAAGSITGQFNLPAHKPGQKPASVNAQYRAMGPGFFRLFGIPLLRGRAFSNADTRDSEPVAVVSRTLAEQMYAGHARGQLIELGQGAHAWTAHIVGVVGDTRQFGPLQPAPPILYTPLAQMPDQLLSLFRGFEPLRFALRGPGNPDEWRAAVRAALVEVAPNQPISNFRTMDQIVASTTATTRMTLLLVGIFAALALLLSVAGLYAVMAVSVAAREREFGVRMALGASPARLTRLVLRGGLFQIVVGLAIGIAIVLAVSGLLTRLLLSLTGRANAFDPAPLIGVCVVLAIAGLAACLVPAWRASRVQPMRALRGE